LFKQEAFFILKNQKLLSYGVRKINFFINFVVDFIGKVIISTK